MYINRRQIKENAKNSLSRGYWSCVLAGLVLAVATGALGNSPAPNNYNIKGMSDQSGSFFSGEMFSYDPGEFFGSLDIPVYMIGTFFLILMIALAVSLILTVFLLQPLEVGCRKFFAGTARGDYDLSDLGVAFSLSYTNIVKIMFLRQLYIFLWSLLFIIPGIIKIYEYRMIPYILAERPDISKQDAFRASRTMMYGSKLDTFIFDLTFIGWFFLDSITFGLVGIFYVNPYYYGACAGLYEFLKVKYSGAVISENAAYGYGQSYPSQPYPAGPYPKQGSGESGTEPKDGKDTVRADDAKPFNTPYGQ